MLTKNCPIVKTKKLWDPRKGTQGERQTLRGFQMSIIFSSPLKRKEILSKNKTTVNHNELIALERGICFLIDLNLKNVFM